MTTKLYKLMIMVVILAMVTPAVVFAQAAPYAGDTTTIALTRATDSESNLGDLVADSMLYEADLLDDGAVNQTVNLALINSNALLADIPAGSITPAVADSVVDSSEMLYLVKMTGAQIVNLLTASTKLDTGLWQISGGKYDWYNKTGDTSTTAWGAYGIQLNGAAVNRTNVYSVVVSSDMASLVTPAKDTTPVTLTEEIQQALYDYASTLGTIDSTTFPLDRITRLDKVVTILHTNDTHGQWEATVYVGKDKDGNKTYTNEGMQYLATLIANERAHNPNALLVDGGDAFQGNAYAYYFRNMPDNAIAQGFNFLKYDAFTLGNHEFNFGPKTFANMIDQLNFAVLGSANVTDTGEYGTINTKVQDYVNFDVDGVKVSMFGLTNPRVYRYELPSNIPGLTFYPVLDVTQPLVDKIRSEEKPDVLVGLTHIGYSPYNDEIDSDTYLADNVTGLDILIGAHSHTTLMQAKMRETTDNPDGVLIAQTGAYATNLGVVNVGLIGGKEVLREGYLIPANEVATSERGTDQFHEAATSRRSQTTITLSSASTTSRSTR